MATRVTGYVDTNFVDGYANIFRAQPSAAISDIGPTSHDSLFRKQPVNLNNEIGPSTHSEIGIFTGETKSIRYRKRAWRTESNAYVEWDTLYFSGSYPGGGTLGPEVILSTSESINKFDIDTFLPPEALVETGQTVANPTFTASYNFDPPYDSIYLKDSDHSGYKDITLTPTSFSSNYSFQKTLYGNSVTFTLDATKGGIQKSKTCTITWVKKAYWFTSTRPGTFDQTWVEGNSSGTLTTTKNRSFTVNATSGQYVYYVYRAPYGTETYFWFNGSPGAMSLAATILMTVNGTSEYYYIYESTATGLGTTQVVIT